MYLKNEKHRISPKRQQFPDENARVTTTKKNAKRYVYIIFIKICTFIYTVVIADYEIFVNSANLEN